MRRLVVLVMGVFLSLSVSAAQSNPPQAGSSEASSQAASPASDDNMIRGSFATILVKPLDSKKLKDGDQVTCQTAGPLRTRTLLIPTGSKVIGHVTQATARGKGDSDSTLGFVFDKIQLSTGKEIAMKGTLQSVAPSIGGASGPNTGTGDIYSNMGKAGAGTGSPVANTAPPNATVGVTANTMKPTSHPLLNSQSEGALGYHDLSMDKSGLLTSTGKEVKLDNGAQMVIRAEIQIPVQ